MKIKTLLVGLSLGSGLLAGLYFLHAQDTTLTQAGAASLTVTNMDWNSLSDFEVELKVIEAMPTISATNLPDQGMDGTFYSAQYLNVWPPLPGDVLGLPVWEIDTNLFLIDDTNFDYAAAQAKSAKTAGGMQAMDSGSGGGFSPDFSFPSNALWLQINGASNGLVYLTLNGTTNGVQYQILSQGALSNAPMSSWNIEGPSIWGSETANSTTTTVAQNGRTNLFMAARSLVSSGGNGVPDWWEILYYGHTGIDVNAQDSAGDGWTIYQKYIMGVAPNVFTTPPAPQLAVTYGPNSIANVSWVASPGPVTGYTLQRTYYPDYPWGAPVAQNFNFPANTNSFADNLSGDNEIDPDGWGPALFVSYTLTATYALGDSPSSTVWLENSGSSLVSVYMIGNGSQDSPYLAVPTLPPGTTALVLSRVDQGANVITGTFTVPVSSITNGLYPLPATWEGTADYSGNYVWYVQTVSANGLTNDPSIMLGQNWDVTGYFWPHPFYDGRVQLKQNLTFLLRAANENRPFQFTEITTNSQQNAFVNPTNYAYAGLYQSDNQTFGANGYFDAFLPFEDNNQYRNFVLSLSPYQDIDGNGVLTTGAGQASGYGLVLLDPPTYQFQPPAPGVTNISPLLATNVTQWLLAEPYNNPGAVGITITGSSQLTYQLAGNAQNIFGLQFQSTELAYGTSGGLGTSTLSPNGSATPSATSPVNIYSGAAQPQFQTTEYDFWNQALDPLPGMSSFSPTNKSRLLILPQGQEAWIAAYAKLAVGTSGTYGYLGQYLANAYVINTNGAVTTNSAGVVSPYGDFFPTNVGPAALVTMPDPNTGQCGTDVVYVVKLALDVNHDGIMDTTFSGPDNTSQSLPFVFWLNNNYDRTNYDADDSTNYEDDVDTSAPGAVSPLAGVPTPDYEYRNASGARIIPTKRDLEDFTRLWVCGVTSNLLAALPPNGTVTLSWGDVGNPNPNNPTIDLFLAADPDGGIGYLTNETVAAAQTNNVLYPNVARLGPGGSLTLNGWQFTNGWVGSHFIWCGVAPGSGQLTLTIADGNGNTLAQASQWIQIEDIKQMYERWTVGDNPTNAPYSIAEPVAEGLAADVPTFHYSSPTATNTPYILFVHGWNLESWEKDRYAETAFKRLYWQGYQGRFGEFRWPTDYGFAGTLWQISTNVPEKDNFDNSEYQAWQSAPGLLNLLTSLNAKYPGHVYMLAHSMGNIVASEAVRLAGNNQAVNAYVASQAAVSAHTYDGNTNDVPNYSFYYPPWSLSADTPNIYGNWFADNNGGGAERVISFYNINDYALQRSAWQRDELLKPDQDVLENGDVWYYGYNGSVNGPPPWNNFYKQDTNSTIYGFNIVTSLNNRYEVMSYAAQSWTTALGATPSVGNLTKSLNLTTVWPSPDPLNNNYASHFFHSAEFRGDTIWEWNYWNTLLFSPQNGFNISNP